MFYECSEYSCSFHSTEECVFSASPKRKFYAAIRVSKTTVYQLRICWDQKVSLLALSAKKYLKYILDSANSENAVSHVS